MEARGIKRLALGAVVAGSVALAGLGVPSPLAYASDGGHPGPGHPGLTQGPALPGVANGTGHRVTDGVLGPLPTGVADDHTPPPPVVRDHRNGDNCLSTAQGGVVVTSTNPPPPGPGGPGQGGHGGRGGYGGGGGYHPTPPFC